MKLTKYLCHILTIKDRSNTDYGIYALAYFHKDGVTSCKEIQKDYDKKERIEKDCDKKVYDKKDYDKKDCKDIKEDCDKKDCKKTSC